MAFEEGVDRLDVEYATRAEVVHRDDDARADGFDRGVEVVKRYRRVGAREGKEHVDVTA